ncbi:hypothetical protein F5890DRAFT_1587094 [Lentinula detonsa]|uniref:Uncharacterized protein n=1 Tax=Lentinula detonsa TaxID=2804962 RepID=A0AA38PWL3_9AGAR|nr:hypothetical protein F5890DRAFT_1587094 [Lentinula detonsa]
MEENSMKGNSPKHSVQSKGKQREETNVAQSTAPSNNTNISNASVSTARYMEYERGIHCRVILQLLQNMDLQNSSTTLISDQGLIMNISEGTVVARELPKVVVAFSPIRDEEFEPYRKKYPAPFSEGDTVRNPTRNRPPASHDGGGGPHEPSDDGGAGDDNKDGQSSQHRSDESEPRVAVPDKFNPRSLVGIGETYSYEPKTVSEEECLNEILRNIPRPEFYYGDKDMMKFDIWVRTLVRWLNVADQCGPEARFSNSRQQWVITAVDIQRVNTLSSFLREKQENGVTI